MDHRANLERLLQDYLSNRSTLDTVRRWLYTHVDDLFDSQDTELRELADVTWTHISELEAGADRGRGASGARL